MSFSFVSFQQEALGMNDIYYGGQGPPSVGSGPRNYAHSGKTLRVKIILRAKCIPGK